jgi:hypothetical protein
MNVNTKRMEVKGGDGQSESMKKEENERRDGKNIPLGQQS